MIEPLPSKILLSRLQSIVRAERMNIQQILKNYKGRFITKMDNSSEVDDDYHYCLYDTHKGKFIIKLGDIGDGKNVIKILDNYLSDERDDKISQLGI